MTIIAVLNVSGVAISAVGSVILWYFMAELNFFSSEHLPKKKAVLYANDSVEPVFYSYEYNRKMSKLGIGLVILGGLMQIASALLPLLASK